MKDQFEIDVTEEEIEFFQENGFLSINQITTDEEIDWMKGLYDQLFNDRWGENEGNYLIFLFLVSYLHEKLINYFLLVSFFFTDK